MCLELQVEHGSLVAGLGKTLLTSEVASSICFMSFITTLSAVCVVPLVLTNFDNPLCKVHPELLIMACAATACAQARQVKQVSSCMRCDVL